MANGIKSLTVPILTDSQAAEDALGICSVAQMLARDDVDCDDPPAAALVIAKQANELNDVLYDLSCKMAKGNSTAEPKAGAAPSP